MKIRNEIVEIYRVITQKKSPSYFKKKSTALDYCFSLHGNIAPRAILAFRLNNSHYLGSSKIILLCN